MKKYYETKKEITIRTIPNIMLKNIMPGLTSCLMSCQVEG